MCRFASWDVGDATRIRYMKLPAQYLRYGGINQRLMSCTDTIDGVKVLNSACIPLQGPCQGAMAPCLDAAKHKTQQRILDAEMSLLYHENLLQGVAGGSKELPALGTALPVVVDASQAEQLMPEAGECVLLLGYTQFRPASDPQTLDMPSSGRFPEDVPALPLILGYRVSLGCHRV